MKKSPREFSQAKSKKKTGYNPGKKCARLKQREQFQTEFNDINVIYIFI